MSKPISLHTQVVLLDTEQAAEFLGLKANTLVDWRWQKKGPPWIPLSRGAVRYDQADLEAWLASRKQFPEAS